MSSSIGSRLPAYWLGCQVESARMSWPDRACASAAAVISRLLPCEGMKAIWTSTFSFAAPSLASGLVGSLAPGTQWSQNPIDTLPAACAERTNGAATTAADAADDVATKRRRGSDVVFIACPPVLNCETNRRDIFDDAWRLCAGLR